MDKDLGRKIEALEKKMDRMQRLMDRIKSVGNDQEKILTLLKEYRNG